MTLMQGMSLAKSFDQGITYIFRGLSFTIGEGRHIALVGANGSGKTTLLKLIVGLEEPSRGGIRKKQGVRIGYQDQEPGFGPEVLVREVLESSLTHLTEIEERMAELEQKMSQARGPELESVLEEYGLLQEQFQVLGGYTREQEMKKVVLGLGLAEEDLERPASSLSGGEKSKILLAVQLLEKPDLLLLDEPTNHLDIESWEAIEEALLQYPGAILFITHDRFFLQKMAEQVIYINGTDSKVHLGDYQSFKEKVQMADQEQPSAQVMVLETKLTALIGKLSNLREEQEEERGQLEAEILALQQQKGVVTSLEG